MGDGQPESSRQLLAGRWLTGRRAVEIICWLFGVGLLLAYGIARTWAWQQQQEGLEEFANLRVQDAASVETWTPPANVFSVPDPDRALWSAKRVRAYETNGAPSTAPLGVLRIPSIKLAVPIYEGTSDSVLDRGAGHITGTAGLDEDGNVAIAAHRDGFFRALKDIRLGDKVIVETLGGDRLFEVTELALTEPSDASVLAPTSASSVTLVTCYPFYFVGSAPQRFIVRAEHIAP